MCKISEQCVLRICQIKNEQNKSCRYSWVEQLWYSSLFMLKSFWVSNFGSNLLFFKISNLKGSNFVKWQDDQNKSCRSSWVEQLLYSSLLHLKSFRVLKFGLNLLNFKFQILKCVKHCHIQVWSNLNAEAWFYNF